jgi:hypothetical protein
MAGFIPHRTPLLIMTLKRIALAVAFAAFYLLVYRDVRVHAIRWVGETLFVFQQDDQPVRMYAAQRTSLYVVRTDKTGTFERWMHTETEQSPASMGESKSKNLFVFTGFGDKYFLLGMVVLLLRGVGWRIAGAFWSLHMGITFFSALMLFLALLTGPLWLYPMNFTIAYITPFATMAFVLFNWRDNPTDKLTQVRPDS